MYESHKNTTATGNTYGPQGSNGDMTVEASEETLSALLEFSQDVVGVVDETGEITYVSPAIEGMLGYSQDAVLGERVIDFVHPEDRAEITGRFAELLDHPGHATDQFPLRLQHENGEWVWVEAVGSNRTDTTLDGFVFTGRDISDRKDRERTLRRMQRAVDASGHAIYITDPTGEIEYVNPAFETITGYPPEVAIGETPAILSSGEMSEAYYENLWETILAGDVWEEEVTNQRRDGDLYHAHQTIAPITDEAGDIEAFVAIQTDISARKELHERLSVMNRILRHDIRSAVSVIRGNARLAKGAETHREDVLETIETEADRLYRLSETARHVEGVLSGDGPGTEAIELSSLLRAKLLRMQNRYADATFRWDLPDDVGVEASVRLEEAFENVLANAVVHNDRDDPEVAVTVSASDQARNGYVEVTIADNGPGIPDAELEPLQAGKETALEHTSGLGLWVVDWIVEESNGELVFEDNDPRGTVVTMRLPAAEIQS